MKKSNVWKDIIEPYLEKNHLSIYSNNCFRIDYTLQKLFDVDADYISFDIFNNDIIPNRLFCRKLTRTEEVLAEFIYQLHKSDEALPPIIIWYPTPLGDNPINWPLVFGLAARKGRFSYDNVNYDKDMCVLFKQTEVRPILEYTRKDFTVKNIAECGKHFIDKILNDVMKKMN